MIDIANLPDSEVNESVYRIILARYPQIDVFERVSSPRDWDLLYALESLANPSRYPCTRVTAGEPQTAYVDA